MSFFFYFSPVGFLVFFFSPSGSGVVEGEQTLSPGRSRDGVEWKGREGVG